MIYVMSVFIRLDSFVLVGCFVVLFCWLCQACYGIRFIPDGNWLCRPCMQGVHNPECVLCPKTGGAMKPIRYSKIDLSTVVYCNVAY